MVRITSEGVIGPSGGGGSAPAEGNKASQPAADLSDSITAESTIFGVLGQHPDSINIKLMQTMAILET